MWIGFTHSRQAFEFYKSIYMSRSNTNHIEIRWDINPEQRVNFTVASELNISGIATPNSGLGYRGKFQTSYLRYESQLMNIIFSRKEGLSSHDLTKYATH